MFGPLVVARTEYEMGIVSWACGHCPSAKVAAVDLNFSPDEIEADDARAIVGACLRDWTSPTPLIVDRCRIELMKLGAWFAATDCPNPDTLPLRAWSEAKLCRLFQRRARVISDLGVAPVDRYLHVVGRGFTANVNLLREVADDERRIRDAVRYVRARAGAERRASP
jgi:hypothetical protein